MKKNITIEFFERVILNLYNGWFVLAIYKPAGLLIANGKI